MTLIEIIILIGSIAGALTAVGVFIGKLYSKIKMVLTTLNRIQEHTEENYMNNLRLIIMSKEMPIGERLAAGEKYVDNDGNGEIKAYYAVLRKKYEREQGIIDD